MDRWNGNCQREGDPADGLWDFRNTGLSDQWNGSQSLEEKRKVSVTLNFSQNIQRRTFKNFSQKGKKEYPELSRTERLLGLLPDKLIKVILKQKDPYRAVTAFPLELKGTSGFEQAQVCTGGVDTGEVDPETLESLLHKGLYLQGNFSTSTVPAAAIIYSGHGRAEQWQAFMRQRR